MDAPTREFRSFGAVVIVALGLVALIGGGLVSAAGRSARTTETNLPDRVPAQASGGLRLELLEQDFAFEADGTIRLVYKLTGDLIGTADLQATTTTSTTTTTAPPTTTPPVQPPESQPAPGLPPDGIPPAATPATTTTTTLPPPPPPPRLTIEITNYAPIRTAARINQLVGSDVDPAAFRDVVDGVALGDLRERAEFAADGSATLVLEIETDVVASIEQKLKFEGPGLYPIRVEILIGDPSDDAVLATAGTLVQRLPGPTDLIIDAPGTGIPATRAPPIDLAIITAITADGPNASAADRRATTRELDAALDLAAAMESSVTLEIPPPIIAERAATPADQRQMADDLADDEFVALPLAPLDVSSAVAVGRADAFARLVRAGEDVLTAAVPTTPSRRDIWIATDPLSAAGARELRDLGVRFVVMPRALFVDTVARLVPTTDQFVNIALPDSGTLALLVVDDLAAQLSPASATEILKTATPTEWAVQTVAEMLVEQGRADQSEQSARRSRILTTPTLGAPDARLLQGLEQLAITTPGVQFTAGSALTGVTDVLTIAGDPVTVDLPEVAGPALAARTELIDATALTMQSAASMLPASDPRPAEWAAELDSLISTGYSDDDVEAATDVLLAEASHLRGAIRLPEPFTFTLTGRSGSIDIRLQNELDEPLDVVVSVSSPKINFPQGDRTVTLRPNGETSVLIPLEARSNGTSAITLEVSTPAGEALADPVTLTSRVTSLTGLGQALTVGFVLVLLTWWFTHWRSKRRSVLAGDGRDRHPSTDK